MIEEKNLKPTVPKFVADWYERNKGDLNFALYDCPYVIMVRGTRNEFEEWFSKGINKPYQTLINMHQFGYSILEPKYLIKCKGFKHNSSYIKYDLVGENWYFGNDTEYSTCRAGHTRKELEEAGFKEVFDNPMFEVVEVKN